MTFHKIVCATDFSEGSRRALQLACRLAAGHGAELVLAHAWQLQSYVGEDVFAPEIIQAGIDDDNRLLDEASAFAREAGVARISVRHLKGVAWRAIVDLATEDPAVDLIVVGTHGRTGVRRVLLGSVAEKIVRLSPVSTLAVHPDDDVGSLRRVLCPTDFSDSARLAGEQAADLVDARDAAVELVHIVDLPRGVDQTIGGSEEVVQQVDLQLERQATGFAWPGHIRWHAEVGRASAELLAALDAEEHDLVAIGSHGRTGLARAWLGSLAELVVRHAHCPVLVARTRATHRR